jgi:hypothetical protein
LADVVFRTLVTHDEAAVIHIAIDRRTVCGVDIERLSPSLKASFGDEGLCSCAEGTKDANAGRYMCDLMVGVVAYWTGRPPGRET